VAAAVFLALAPAPILYKYYIEAQNAVTLNKVVHDKALGLEGVEKSILSEQKMATDVQTKIAKVQGLVNSRFNWISFFSDLQTILFNIKDAWLDSLTVVRTAAPADASVAPAPAGAAAAGAPAAAQASYKLQVSGAMLLRDTITSADSSSSNDLATSRVRSLLDNFAKTPFVKKVETDSLKFDFNTTPHVVRFDFTVDIDPDKPL